MNEIPKIIHYCWFGGNPKNSIIEKCMKSWKKYLPDYTFVEWSENNFNINSVKFVKEAYKNKKWAFVSDYVRLYALYNQGGIYLDTDVEITNNLDKFLNGGFFAGFETEEFIGTGVIGSKPKHSFLSKVLKYYENLSFEYFKDKLGSIVIPKILTENLINGYELKKIDGEQILKDEIYIYPRTTFCIKSIQKDNYAIHHFNGSWLPNEELKDEKMKYKKNYILLSELTNAYLSNENSYVEQIKKLNSNHMAIYGIGNIGKMFYSQLKNNNIKVELFIDNNSITNIYDGVNIAKSHKNEIENIDCIIVTVTYEFYKIKENLEKITGAKIVSLEEILGVNVLF
ncbi:glycosyltransferase family 32 protein [Clostridium felsineum]|uniref:glycosyltransferase family 32 protein n=1 Tax=Clostridium felsineum TaxID=36839 RepID=UPI001A9A2E29|nr:glycosyltransferase [Clostridium felsineum]